MKAVRRTTQPIAIPGLIVTDADQVLAARWNTSPLTQLSWPTRVLINVPRIFHIFMLLSPAPVATYSAELLAGGGFFNSARVSRCPQLAGGANTQHSIKFSWPSKVAFASPDKTFHTTPVLSLPPATSHCPSKGVDSAAMNVI